MKKYFEVMFKVNMQNIAIKKETSENNILAEKSSNNDIN